MHVINGNTTIITRTAYYKNNITTIEKYYFDGDENNVELVPVSHTIQVLNAVRDGPEYILQYEVQRLLYTGETKKGVSSPQSFGHKMKVEWESGNYYSKVYKYKDIDEGKITIKYRIDSEDFQNDVRLFDPFSDSLKTHLISYYKLDEISGTNAEDIHSGTYNGTASNSNIFTSQAEGILNTGADFSFGEDYINGYNLYTVLGSNNFSISVWAYINTSLGAGDILNGWDNNNGSTIRSDGNDLITYIYPNDYRLTTIGAFPTDGWYNIILVLDASDNESQYVNGVLLNSTITEGMGNPGKAFKIGSSANLGNFFESTIDEV